MNKYIIALIILLLLAIFVPLFISNNNYKIMEEKENLILKSSAFENMGQIPSKYTCDEENRNPVFEISGVNAEAKSLVLIMDDPDAPTGTWDHWVKFNIPPTVSGIDEGIEPEGISGKGTSGNFEYKGPCPPDREHRYFFKLYSLDSELNLPEGSSKREVEDAMEGHVLQSTELVGLYERK